MTAAGPKEARSRPPEKLVRVPEDGVVQDGGTEVSERWSCPHQHVGADEGDERQVLGHQRLHAVVLSLALLRVAGRELAAHELVYLLLPGSGGVRLGAGAPGGWA